MIFFCWREAFWISFADVHAVGVVLKRRCHV